MKAVVPNPDKTDVFNDSPCLPFARGISPCIGFVSLFVPIAAFRAILMAFPPFEKGRLDA